MGLTIIAGLLCGLVTLPVCLSVCILLCMLQTQLVANLKGLTDCPHNTHGLRLTRKGSGVVEKKGHRSEESNIKCMHLFTQKKNLLQSLDGLDMHTCSVSATTTTETHTAKTEGRFEDMLV